MEKKSQSPTNFHTKSKRADDEVGPQDRTRHRKASGKTLGPHSCGTKVLAGNEGSRNKT